MKHLATTVLLTGALLCGGRAYAHHSFGATYDKTAELTPPGSWLAACARAEISNNIEGIAKAAEAHNGGFPPALREALGIANRGYILQTGEIVLTDDAHKLAANPEVKRAYLGG